MRTKRATRKVARETVEAEAEEDARAAEGTGVVEVVKTAARTHLFDERPVGDFSTCTSSEATGTP